jgi:DNA-directed RNA polymerase specialized sigma24 family protein
MRMREEMSYEEIGEALKVLPNTASTWVYRIREELKAEASRLLR